MSGSLHVFALGRDHCSCCGLARAALEAHEHVFEFRVATCSVCGRTRRELGLPSAKVLEAERRQRARFSTTISTPTRTGLRSLAAARGVSVGVLLDRLVREEKKRLQS